MTKQIDTSEEKIWSAVSYLWILSLVALAARKDNEFIKFHASQGALLFVASLILMFIPVVGWLINLLIGVLAIIGIVKALQGEKWELPLVADMAQKFGDWIIKTVKL
ncbi:MAG: hypothetical protein WC244_01960 [Patescibacteria group bacterium]|jgi:uncharacterized membrane protein